MIPYPDSYEEQESAHPVARIVRGVVIVEIVTFTYTA